MKTERHSHSSASNNRLHNNKTFAHTHLFDLQIQFFDINVRRRVFLQQVLGDGGEHRTRSNRPCSPQGSAATTKKAQHDRAACGWV